MTCTCVRVPVFTGHSAAIVAEFSRELSVERGDRRPRGGTGGGAGRNPDPADGGRGRLSYVGRLRRAQGAPHALAFFVVGDNLRKGAALNVVQIAEALVAARSR